MNLNSWMTDSITVATITSVNTAGEAQYTTQRTVKCRIEPKLQKVVNSEGQEIMSNHEIAMLEDIGLQDLIWLPDTTITNRHEARTAHNIARAKSKSGTATLRMVYL